VRLPRFLIWLLIFALVDLGLLGWVAAETSWVWVLAWVIGTGIAGAVVTRRAAARSRQRIFNALAQGELPTTQVLDDLLLMVAGVLLFCPGLLGDLVGLLLLVPALRPLAKGWVVARLGARFFHWPAPDAAEPQHDKIVDVQVIDVEHRTPPEQQ
jgi:UPF0716 protein FxsA